ncbi:hypothetical protein PQS30_06165 [Bacillus licheniformis]|uniref:hypothetical protein n=1 Tax=Bacillus licheniformis TaxID=1402 RepID=UPI00397942F9
MNLFNRARSSTVISCNGKVTINGVTYEGNNIIITDNKVQIDGRTVERDVTEDVKVKIEGSPVKVYSDASVEVRGDVLGDVDSGLRNVKGNVDAGGSVRCGTVGGSVDAGGSIRIKEMN